MSLKIYFAGSIRGGRQDVEIYFKIIEELKTYGEVLTEFVGDKNIKANSGTESDTYRDHQIHDNDVRMLSECDYLVAEVTQPSLGVGYEIGRAVGMGKKILCLYRPQKDKNLSAMISGAANGDTFVVQNYTDVTEAPDILKNYFSQKR